MKSFGEAIKEKRIKLGLTQKQVAESVGVTDAYICSLESGKRCPPPYRTVATLAEAIGLNVDRLWELAVKDRKKQALEKSQRKLMTQREQNEDVDEPQIRKEVPDSQINEFFERPEVQMATFGLFQKQPGSMSMEEKRIVFYAVSEARESISELID
jgi:transcriptional regulator with XRE-family HTH domain